MTRVHGRCAAVAAAMACILAADGLRAQAPPPVTGVKAFHRAGQTFITWNEIAPLISDEQVTYGQYKKALAGAKDAWRYAIYRSDRPIGAGALQQAEKVGEVGPLSACNVNARNKEYLIGQALIQPDEIGELARHYNSEMRRWGMDHPRMARYPLARFVIDEKAGPLPPGTGLFVHHPQKAGKGHYAVVAVRGDSAGASGAGSVAGPVTETVGTGVPVRQGKGLHGPYFDYPGTRWVYVQWCAPPLAPRTNMYFNWSVLIPPHAGDPDRPALPGMEAFGKVPAELYFHRAGYSYAQPNSKMLVHSIQLATHDYPPSGWYGYHEDFGGGEPLKAGKVVNHTQQRIIAFLDWAVKHFPIARDQVICAGADGAAALALNYPETFAYVWITGFNRRGGVLDPEAAGRYEAAWGPKGPEITDAQGRGNWEWAELDKLALAAERDLPLFVCLGHSWGRIKGYAKGRGRFYEAMQEARQPLMAYWGWSGLRNRGNVSKYTGRWRGKLLTRHTAVPAFSNSSRNSDREATGNASGSFNWKDVVDTAKTFAVTVISREGTFDLTPRRTQRFRPKPGQEVRWEAVAPPNPRDRDGKPTEQSGVVGAAKDGTVTAVKLNYPKRSPSMTVTFTLDK